MVESHEIKVLWDFMMQCDYHIECRKPNIVVGEKEGKKCSTRYCEQEAGKMDR